MEDKTEYELGARHPVARTWPDPVDEFSQKAAENEKPRSGQGLSDMPERERKRSAVTNTRKSRNDR